MNQSAVTHAKPKTFEQEDRDAGRMPICRACGRVVPDPYAQPCCRCGQTNAGQQSVESFQARVEPWMLACFGPEIAGDREERNHRFMEEALELVQSTGCLRSEAHQLVDYVFDRNVGQPSQEVGGVQVTLAALCLANAIDMHQAGEIELARIWTKVEKIRAKQAAKPKHSPLPEHVAKPARPFSTYPEDHEKMLRLCTSVLERNVDADKSARAASKLADLVKAILEDEQAAEGERRDDEEQRWRRGDVDARLVLDDPWQPIETAPLDGTFIDLWAVREKTGRAHRYTNCQWGYASFGCEPVGEKRWLGLDDRYSAVTPLHWMLPPAAPSTPGGAS